LEIKQRDQVLRKRITLLRCKKEADHDDDSGLNLTRQISRHQRHVTGRAKTNEHFKTDAATFVALLEL
jgi:hypothetical protein